MDMKKFNVRRYKSVMDLTIHQIFCEIFFKKMVLEWFRKKFKTLTSALKYEEYGLKRQDNHV